MKKKENKDIRPSWDEYFLSLVEIVGTRGTCDRGKAGSVAVKDRQILISGYVGAPIGLPHCDDVGHEMHTVTNVNGKESRHCIRTTHSEQNVVAQAARRGIALDGATIYTHMTPCYTCAKILINSGVKRIVCSKDYHGGERSKEIFKDADVLYELISKEVEKYNDM